MRAVRPYLPSPTACAKPPFRIRLARAINRQAASPSGLFGRFLGLVWRREHARSRASPAVHLLVAGRADGVRAG